MRYRIDVIRGEWVSVCGPDYERSDEHLVIEIASGRVVLRFSESGDWPYLTAPAFSGANLVEVDVDETHVTVHDHDGSQRRIPIPA